MRRTSRPSRCLVGAAVAVAGVTLAQPAAAASLVVRAPAHATVGRTFALRVGLAGQAQVAGLQAAVGHDASAAEVGQALPLVAGGRSLGAGRVVGFYGASGKRARGTVGAILVTPSRAGRLQLRIAGLAAVDARGRTVARGAAQVVEVVVGEGRALRVAPAVRGLAATTGLASSLAADGATADDLAVASLAFEQGRAGIGDVQALAAAEQAPRALAAAVPGAYVVDSAGDAADATPGDGVCATAAGACTLRAAVAEANANPARDAISFNVPPNASGGRVVITLGSSLRLTAPQTTIDGSTQPGASVNTDPFLSNARVLVELRYATPRGDSTTPILHVTTGGHVIRGLALTGSGRGIYLTWGANDNRVVGNWFGVDGTGAEAGNRTSYFTAGIELNNGKRNLIGTAAVADRNVFGGRGFGIHGNGANANVIRGNLIGFLPGGRPSGGDGTGIDMNTASKANVIGGTAAGERNVFAAFRTQAIELSHGWNPASSTDRVEQWAVTDNRIAGNWIGLKADGTYDAAYLDYGTNARRSVDDWAFEADGINVYDGSSRNVIERNVVMASVAGLSTGLQTTDANIWRGNTIGLDVAGTPGASATYGIVLRAGATGATVQGNTFVNVATGVLVRGNSTQRNRITGNAFRGLRGMPIDLAPTGAALGVQEPNDAGDVDGGPNAGYNHPVMGTRTASLVRGTANAGATVEVYRSVGGVLDLLGSAVAGTDGRFSLAATIDPTWALAATATGPTGNTSELSPALPA